MNTEKYRQYAYLTVALVGAALLIFVFFRYVFAVVAPFFFAWGLVLLTRPTAVWLSDKTRCPLRVCRVLVALLLLLGGLTVVSFLIIRIGTEGVRFLAGLGEGGKLTAAVEFLMNPLGGLLDRFPDIAALEDKIGEAAGAMMGELVSAAAGVVPTVVRAVPKIFLFVLVTVIASVYFAWDLDAVHARLRAILPSRVATPLLHFKNGFMSGVFPYLRAYLILMLLTFSVMTFGLVILGAEYALLLAVVIALLDALPVIGVGTILVPWSLFQMFFGDTRFGVGLLILYVVHEVIRQFAEPRIVGRHLGIHPLLTLILLYAGYSFFGILGLLFMPLLTVTLHVLLPGGKNRRDTPDGAGHPSADKGKRTDAETATGPSAP